MREYRLTYHGSSPRVWGAHLNDLSAPRLNRLIPTCVGSTLFGLVAVLPGPAHPHVCGEHNRLFYRQSTPVGSSPRVWGARSCSRPSRTTLRLIPTCVGSTSVRTLMPSCTQAHPHVCGEHGLGFRVLSRRCRLIPTCVGSTKREIRPGVAATAHPHVCGEHPAGSMCRPYRARLIPTCVGSTERTRSRYASSAAHPHVCGEHPINKEPVPTVLGSSPRVWGAHARASPYTVAPGLIPTCVGSTY